MSDTPSALIGIKQLNGEIRFVYCRGEHGYPGYVLPKLLMSYNDAEKARALISRGDFVRISHETQEIIAVLDLANPRTYSYLSFAGMENNFRAEKTDMYIYIFAENEWTCAVVGQGNIVPFLVESVAGKLVLSGVTIPTKKDLYPYDKWVERYFSLSTTPPKARIATAPRLSKEDWLKANYPEMTELPKWRFPVMATA
jgi:hypothetical protein